MRECTSCKQLKDEKHFHKRKESKDGLAPICKPCHSVLDKNRYKQRRLRIAEEKANQKAVLDIVNGPWRTA